MSSHEPMRQFELRRIQELLTVLERMAAGDTHIRLPLSAQGDELDAIAHAINVLADELRWTHERMLESERREMAEIRKRDRGMTGGKGA